MSNVLKISKKIRFGSGFQTSKIGICVSDHTFSPYLFSARQYKNILVPDKGRVFNTALIFTLELGFMLDCAETIAISALERKESRGAHARTDMPDRDDKNWLKHVLVYKENDDAYRVDYLPVVITQWKPEERKY